MISCTIHGFVARPSRNGWLYAPAIGMHGENTYGSCEGFPCMGDHIWLRTGRWSGGLILGNHHAEPIQVHFTLLPLHYPICIAMRTIYIRIYIHVTLKLYFSLKIG